MMKKRRVCARDCVLACLLLQASLPAFASVVEYTDRDEWTAAVGEFSTITFTEYPVDTFVTDHYAHLGVYFTDGADQIGTASAFVNDGHGLRGVFDETTLVFATPLYSLGIDFPGNVQITLYLNDEVIYMSPLLGATFTGNFGGLVSSNGFDRALLVDPLGGLAIDDLHFGPPIPAPGAFALMLAGIRGLPPSRCRAR